MSDKPIPSTGAKELAPGSKNAGVLTRGAWAKKLEREERDLGQVKEGDGNMGRRLQLRSGVYQQIRDASILQGESQATTDASIRQGGSQAPFDSPIRQRECRSVVSTPLTVLSPDGSPSQVAKGDSVRDGDLSHQSDDVHSKDWSDMPDDVVLSLFKYYLKPGDVLASSQTCQLWRVLGENDKLWEYKCEQAGLAYSLNTANRISLGRRRRTTNFAYSAWKENFLKPYKIARKFREGIPQVITIEMRHFVHYLEFFNNKIVTTRGKNISVFCALSGKLLHELVEHTNIVSAIQMDALVIVSGSYDRSVKVWDVKTGSCLHTLLDHTGGVICLSMHGGIAVSGSSDGTLWMWNVREGNCIKVLTGHTRYVSNVQFDGRHVVSSSYKRIKVWDPQTGQCLHTLSHNSPIRCLKFNGTAVVAGYEDGWIKVWEVDTGICRHTLEGNDLLYKTMELQGDELVCRGADITTAKIWNIATGACLHTLAGLNKHSDRITSIQINENFVFTGSEDGKVKLWDLKTGQLIRDLVFEAGGRVREIRMKAAKIMCEVKCWGGRFKLLVLNFDTYYED